MDCYPRPWRVLKNTPRQRARITSTQEPWRVPKFSDTKSIYNFSAANKEHRITISELFALMDSMTPGQCDNCSHIPCKDKERLTEGEFCLRLKAVFIGDRGTVDGIKGTDLQPPHCATTLFQIPKNVSTVPQLP